MSIDPPPMWTTKQVARRLGVDAETVCAYVRDGKLQGAFIGRGYRFELAWVEAFLASSRKRKPRVKRAVALPGGPLAEGM